MKRSIALAFLILAMLATAGLAGCGSDDSGTTSADDKSSGTTSKKKASADDEGKDSSDNEGAKFTGTATRAETFCFNGKCSTCNTTDKVTLTLDGSKVKIDAEGPVLTFPSCAPESGVSNNEWTLQGTFNAGATEPNSGAFLVSSCKGEAITTDKWQGAGSGSIEGGNTAKADFQCTGTDDASSNESDKSEWKSVVLNKQ